MSIEIDPHEVKLVEGTSTNGASGKHSDRVLITASDRPSSSQDSLPALVDPAFDHQHDLISARRHDVEEKHERILRFLRESGYDAVLLGHRDSLAWLSSGGDLAETMTGETGAVRILVNTRGRYIVSDNVQSARVFEEEVGGLGFQLKEWPWHADPGVMIHDLTRGKRVASDGFALPNASLSDESMKLKALRYPFTSLERQRLRELGRTMALTIEATCRNFEPGENEADLAGHISHRLFREGVTPVDLRVAADDRLIRFRQPRFKSDAILRKATLMAVGRRHGLCAAVSRTISFGTPEAAFEESHALAAMVDATAIFFSRPGETVDGVFQRIRRIFEKNLRPDEWMLDYQGFLMGYADREQPLRPGLSLALTHGMPVSWSPSVEGARSQDTVVVDERGLEVVTQAQRWPMLEVLVKGFPVSRPGILIR